MQTQTSSQLLPSNERRAKITIVLLWCVIGFHILAALTHFGYVTGINLLDSLTLLYWGYWPYNEIALHILFTVYFIMWFRRAYANLRRQGKQTRYSDGWAAGAWFVPVLNLFRPYQIMREIWEYTFRASKSVVLLGWWWALWLASRLVWNFSIRSEMSNMLNNGQQHVFELFADLLSIASALLLLFIVRKISAADHSKTLS